MVSQLTREQRQKIVDRPLLTTRYLANMHGRMNQRLFPEDNRVARKRRRANTNGGPN